jgi:hypothetical protein
MTRSALRVEECCSWCRQPVGRCQDPSCDDARTYSGILLRGMWREVEEAHSVPSERTFSSTATLATAQAA